MFCRVCGANINDKAEVCVKCGCNPLNGKQFCQVCGANTTENQEMCTKCGCRLSPAYTNANSGAMGISMGGSGSTNFSNLDPYWQQEFTQIMNSNEQYKGKFNICAFLFGCIWALTKGLWLSALIAIGVSILTAGVGGVVYWFIFGIRGNYMYYNAYVKNKQLPF